MGLIDDLKGSIDSVLGVRDSIGAVLKPVYFVTRTWYSDEARTVPSEGIGGFAKDVEVQMLPSPGIRDYTHDLRALEGGMVKQGDIILENVSGNSYTEAQLDGTSASAHVEKLYRVGEVIYQVISVKEKYVTWNVQLRRISDQTRYP
jgi:hypothetical protein